MFFASAALVACDASAADLPSQQAAPAKPPSPAANPCFASVYDFLSADPDACPLAWNGIRLYGRFDYGAGYDLHGVPFNGVYPNGVETLISKNSNGARFTLVPNGLGQTHVGIKGEEHIVSDWSLVFKFENGFDPYTLQRANGPKSLVQNNTTAARRANCERRLEPGRAALQHRGLYRIQQSDLWRTACGAAELPYRRRREPL